VSVINAFRKPLVFVTHFKGATAVSRIFPFWGENVLKFKLNTFSRTRNAPKTTREGNKTIISKGEQTIVSFWRCFQERKKKLEKISLMFSNCNPFPHLIKVFRELVE